MVRALQSIARSNKREYLWPAFTFNALGMRIKVEKAVAYQMNFVRVRFKMDQEGRKDANALGIPMRLRLIAEMISHSMGRRNTRMPARRCNFYTYIRVTFLGNTWGSKDASKLFAETSWVAQMVQHMSILIQVNGQPTAFVNKQSKCILAVRLQQVLGQRRCALGSKRYTRVLKITGMNESYIYPTRLFIKTEGQDNGASWLEFAFQ